MSDRPVEQTPFNETTLAEHITDNMSEDKLRSIVRDNLREGYANQGKFFQHDWDENFGQSDVRRYQVTVTSVAMYDVLASSDQEAYTKVHNYDDIKPTSTHITTDAVHRVEEARHGS